MEQVLRELQNYDRWLRLEKELPRMEEALAEGKDRRIEAVGRTAGAKWELDRLEKPGFFLRLRGNLEEKKDEARREYRDSQIQLQTAKEEEARLAQDLSDAKAEFAALSSSWEGYLREKARFDECAEEEKQLLADICLRLIRDCLDALEQARPWMQVDVRRRGVSYGNRKLEFLSLAEETANRIRAVAEQLPAVELPSYVRSPCGFVTAVTMEYKQLDRLNLAIEQVRDLRSKLREWI